MDWTAMGSIAAVLGLPLAYYLGVRHSRALIYVETYDPPEQACTLHIENKADNPVNVSSLKVIWPRGYKVGIQEVAPRVNDWEDAEETIAWRNKLGPRITVMPGQKAQWLFLVRPSKPDRLISCFISLHVDESRWTQISMIRVVKVVQMPATTGK